VDKKVCTVCLKPFYPRDKFQLTHAACLEVSQRVLVIPDTQVKPGVNTDHLADIGKYIADKQPDVIIHLGDHFDLPSLSSYDVGKRQFEGRRLRNDIDAGIAGMERLVTPFKSIPGYNPRMEFLMGNHENRLTRAIDSDAKLEGTLSLDQLRVADYGWTVNEFLEVIEVGGCEFSHYFTSGVMGRPVSSAAVLLRERAQSAIQGHVQRFDMAVHPKTGQIAMFAGIAYTHQEEYLTPQGNGCRQQVVMLHELRDGIFDPMFVSLNYLSKRYKSK
jgi:hypothetical protein